MARKYQKGISALHLIVIVLVIGCGLVWLMSYSKSQDDLAQKAIEAKKSADAAQVIADNEKKKQLAAEQEELAHKLEVEKQKSESLKALDAISKLVKRWDDASLLASSTARIALSGPISQLQSIRRESSDLIVPACISHHKELLIKSMDLTLDGYISFMQDKDIGQYLAQSAVEKAAPLRAEFDKGYSDCKEGLSNL